MNAPDKIYLEKDKETEKIDFRWGDRPVVHSAYEHIEYIRKDALLDYLQKELERLWELIPDASNEAPTQMEMRYLGEYMATERLIDEIKSL